MCVVADALAHGAKKYGPYNWRDIPIEVSQYISAARRHLGDYYDGEEHDPDSNVHHIAHAIAGLTILMDAIIRKKLIDDRPKTAPTSKEILAASVDSDPQTPEPFLDQIRDRATPTESVADRGLGSSLPYEYLQRPRS